MKLETLPIDLNNVMDYNGWIDANTIYITIEGKIIEGRHFRIKDLTGKDIKDVTVAHPKKQEYRIVLSPTDYTGEEKDELLELMRKTGNIVERTYYPYGVWSDKYPKDYHHRGFTIEYDWELAHK